MRLPGQSPPVSRTPDGTLDRRNLGPGDRGPRGTTGSQGQGINPSDYRDCYRLRGLAQKLCLSYY
jgi:hypothetical protein